jgi:hypothetical protein
MSCIRAAVTGVMRNSSAEERIWKASSLSLFGFTVFVSFALASFAAVQTSFSSVIAYLVTAARALLAADKPAARDGGMTCRNQSAS